MVKLVLLAGRLLLIMTAAERLLPPPEMSPEIVRSPNPLGSPQHAISACTMTMSLSPSRDASACK